MSKGGVISIDTVVREAIADKGYSTLHLYPRYLHFALRMLRKLDIDFSEEIKTKRIRVTKRKTVPYPDDYIIWSKIGVKIGDRLWVMVRDNTITYDKLDKYTPNSSFIPEAQKVIGRTYRFYNYVNDEQGIRGYIDQRGYGYNGVGYFQPVDSCKEFQLSSEVKHKEVILEYVSSSFDPDSETFVPITAQDLIRNYIHYQDARFNNTTGMGKTSKEEQEYLDELSQYQMRLSDLSFQGILDVSRRSASLAPRN